MKDLFYPTEAQLFSLYRFLVLLRNDQMYWHNVEPWSGKIKIKVEPADGDFEVRIFKIDSEGRIDSNEFKDRL